MAKATKKRKTKKPRGGKVLGATLSSYTAVIPSAQTTSGEVDLRNSILVGFWCPAAMTGTTITATCAPVAGGTHGAILGFSKTFVANQYIPLDPKDMQGVRFIKLVSNASEGAQRTLVLATRAPGA